MDFSHNPGELEFRAYMRSVLTAPAVAAELTRLRAAGGEADERPLYRLLGQAGLLAPAWPAEYGGQGRDAADAVIVLEELVSAGIPDTLYVNGIQTVGQLVLTCGTPQQRSRFLPPLARGESFAAVLYTEPDAGSDLGSLTTSAAPAEGGYRISGTKLFSLKSRFADLGLCAARLPTPGPKYAGITLFLIDLRAPGVTVRLLPSIAQEQFHAVELEEVWAGPDAVLGGAGDGWAVLARALPYERTGIDLAARAGRWYRLARPAGDPAVDPAAELENAGRHGARAQAARLLAWRAANTVASGHVDEVAIAVAKWYCGEIAAEMAQWLFERHGLGTADQVAAEAGRAFLEAPGLTLSGGTSEMMLQLVAGYLLGADTTEG